MISHSPRQYWSLIISLTALVGTLDSSAGRCIIESEKTVDICGVLGSRI